MHNLRSVCWLAMLLGCGSSNSGTSVRPDAGRPDGSLADADAALSDAGADPDADASSPSTLEACLSDLGEPDFGFLGIQRFRSADGKVRVARARQIIDAPTVGETFAYALVRFWIESDEEPGTCVRGKSALTYEYAHHNWNETWSAETDLALYEGAEVFSPIDAEVRWADTLTAKSKDGKVLWGPLELEEDGCSSLPYDLNACSTRTRSDEPPPGWGE